MLSSRIFAPLTMLIFTIFALSVAQIFQIEVLTNYLSIPEENPLGLDFDVNGFRK